jgi:hypothetical protein
MKNEKVIETKICKHCSCPFNITDKDLEFYEKVSPVFQNRNNVIPAKTGIYKNEKIHFDDSELNSEWQKNELVKDLWNGKIKYLIPDPTLCPDCRQQRRLSFMNERNLYKNTCFSCWDNIVSRFNTECWLTIFCSKCWLSDKRNMLEKWKDMDFSKPFFQQIEELIRETPFENMAWSEENVANNAKYTNHTGDIKDSYLVFESDFVENCYYSRWLKKSNNLVDCLICSNSEYLYECVGIEKSYKLFYSFDCIGCNDSYFLKNCNWCSFCIWCTNLNNKKYFIFNKEKTKEEFEEISRKLQWYDFLASFTKKFYENFSQSPHLGNRIINSENCNWDYIINSKNCWDCYDIIECQDLKYCQEITYSSDLMDISMYWSNSSYMYEWISVWRYSKDLLFSFSCWKWEKNLYCFEVKKSKNCFGCVNLKWQEYCILNKQYSKEAYEKLVPKIIEHMQKTWEWWEFFPSYMSCFWYNETLAQEYFPLSREKVLCHPEFISGSLKGKLPNYDSETSSEWQEKEKFKKWEIFNWSDYEAPFPKVEKIIPASKLPENISEIPDDILNWAIECEITKKPFKIIPQELEFYRKHNLPIPRRHPDQRHLDRMRLRNPRKLFTRKCDKCGKDIQTTYPPERSEIVYCESCYNKEIY